MKNILKLMALLTLGASIAPICADDGKIKSEVVDSSQDKAEKKLNFPVMWQSACALSGFLGCGIASILAYEQNKSSMVVALKGFGGGVLFTSISAMVMEFLAEKGLCQRNVPALGDYIGERLCGALAIVGAPLILCQIHFYLRGINIPVSAG